MSDDVGGKLRYTETLSGEQCGQDNCLRIGTSERGSRKLACGAYITDASFKKFYCKRDAMEVAGGNVGSKEVSGFFVFILKKETTTCSCSVGTLSPLGGGTMNREERMGSNAPEGGGHLRSGDRSKDRRRSPVCG